MMVLSAYEEETDRMDDIDFSVPPVSDCCHRAIVYYRPDAARYVQWMGWWGVESDRFRCSKCNRHCRRNKWNQE